jgi:hypothetical protein
MVFADASNPHILIETLSAAVGVQCSRRRVDGAAVAPAGGEIDTGPTPEGVLRARGVQRDVRLASVVAVSRALARSASGRAAARALSTVIRQPRHEVVRGAVAWRVGFVAQCRRELVRLRCRDDPQGTEADPDSG